MRAELNKQITGNCECCPRINVALTTDSRTGMKMCSQCLSDQNAAIARQKAVEVIEKSHVIDNSISIKADIFNAATVPFTELIAAIQNNDAIPADQKHYAVMMEADARIKKMTEAIATKKAEVLAEETAKNAWVRNAQEIVAKMRADERAKFRQYDMTYVPAPVTKAATSPSKSGKGYDRVAVNEAAKKYNVDRTMIQMMVTQRAGLTPDAAAREIHENRQRKLAAKQQVN